MPPRIHLIIGPMFAGKTNELLRRMRRKRLAGKKVVLIKPRMDSRFSQDDVISHDNLLMKADFVVDRLSEVKTDATDLFVTEGQFYPDAAETILLWAQDRKEINVDMLNASYKQEVFPLLPKLLPYAEVTWMSSICARCGYEGAFFHRQKVAFEGDLHVGGAESYEVVCDDCFYNEKIRNSSIMDVLQTPTGTCSCPEDSPERDFETAQTPPLPTAPAPPSTPIWQMVQTDVYDENGKVATSLRMPVLQTGKPDEKKRAPDTFRRSFGQQTDLKPSE